jgi:tRNA threonylcarbamoyladenosine biosynthesis protein TsaE
MAIHMAHDITLDLADEAATLALGARLSEVLKPGVTIYFHGDLGAGKTTLVRGLLHQLGHIGKVKSPTYTLVEPYVIPGLAIPNIYHFDLYRFIDPEEWDAAGFRDYFNPQSICLVEWPEKAGDLLPDADIDVHLMQKNPGRQAIMSSNTNAGKQCLAQFSKN